MLTVDEASLLRDGGRGIAIPDVGVGVCRDCLGGNAGWISPTSENKSPRSSINYTYIQFIFQFINMKWMSFVTGLILMHLLCCIFVYIHIS